MTGPLRAMTQARLELISNAMGKGSGKAARLSAAVVLVLGLACLSLPFYMFMVFGRQLGEDLPETGGISIVWLATLHGLLVFGMGSAAGLRQHRGFDRELLRSLPLRPSQLLLSELPFALLDTIPLLGVAFFGGLGVGMVRAQPSAAPGIVLVMLLGVLSVLLMQQLVGTVRRLVGRSLFAGIAAVAVATPIAIFVGLSATEGVAPAVKLFLSDLPSTLGYRGLQAWLLGETAAAEGYLAGAVAFVGALFGATVWLQLRELAKDPPLRLARAGDGNLWSFGRPWVGIARLFVSQVLSASYGKVLCLAPFFVTGVFTLCAVKVQYVAPGSVMEKVFDSARTYPLYAIVPSVIVILGGGLWMNQFAWDGRGVKTLLLAPVSSAVVLRGKLVGLGAILLPQSLLACAPLAFLGSPRPDEIGSGLAAGAFLTCLLGTAGQLLSVRFPRKLAEAGAGVEAAPASLQLQSGGLVAVAGGICFGTYVGLRSLHPWAPAAGFALLTLGAYGLRLAARSRLTAAFDANRETLAERLG